MHTVNRQWRLSRRPTGMVSTADFTPAEQTVPKPEANELLVRNLYVSFDPAMRAFMNDGPSYAPPQPVGEVMRAGAIGQVVESRVAGIGAGDIVTGGFGWQDYAVARAGTAMKIVPRKPLTYYMSVLGGTGLTAYVGLVDIAHIAAGETVLVSGAAGATGSTAAQVAKVMGCRTIGIAGGPSKTRWLLDELKLDAAIDYKSEDVPARLKALCPDGINVYFDNVGGPTLEAAIGQMALHGRVTLCGMISGYNLANRQPGPSNLFEMITRRIHMEGFLLFDHTARFEEARRQLETWIDAGQIKAYVDVQEGFENIPATFLRIFNGDNVGKQLLKIADPAA